MARDPHQLLARFARRRVARLRTRVRATGRAREEALVLALHARGAVAAAAAAAVRLVVGGPRHSVACQFAGVIRARQWSAADSAAGARLRHVTRPRTRLMAA